MDNAGKTSKNLEFFFFKLQILFTNGTVLSKLYHGRKP